MNDQWIEFADQIKRMYGKNIVPLHEPTFDETEIKYVTDCVQSGWVSSVGSYVDRFERDLAEYTGVKRAVAVVNGTSALHISLKIAGVQANEEVFMPSLTFIATANAVSYLQAIPHFVDVNESTLGLDPQKLEEHIKDIGEIKNRQLFNKQTGRLIRAVVPMHTFGHPVDLDLLLEVCEKYHLVLVEDAAESLGSYYKGKHTGGFGLASALSFNGNKIITTGGGGAILTNDDQLADYAKHLTTTAKVPHKWEYVHDEIGYNHRMPNINAALGCAQLEKIEGFIQSKRDLVNEYQRLTKDMLGVKLFTECDYAKSNYWLQALFIDPEQYKLDEILAQLNGEDVIARPIWTPLHLLPIYETSPKSNLDITVSIKRNLINVPSNPLRKGV
ncbi:MULTISPECIES: LegC family aminotransferase [Sporosarcina]|uniref:Perosamine synthetase n=1 Tax=Sporosarcina newyorkensis TaxID=759851 RepID=A0A1T4Y1I7_9BACL|nr:MULTISPECIES: LegC family aminotransferase [Sporosarcina]MBY0223492.1 LegC family aminotransferase [Sporosarcina aquimarina]SKA95674.1 perosamine synthetase [Sporosarcina newyorkensis]